MEVDGRLKETKDTWKLRVICDSKLDSFGIRDVIGTIGKTWMGSENQMAEM